MKHLCSAGSILVIVLVLTGCFTNSDEYSDATIEKAQKTVESYIRNNYEDIKTVEFNNDHSNPMGGLMIRGKVNGQAGFVVDVDPDDFTVGSIGEKEGFPKRRAKCETTTCDYKEKVEDVESQRDCPTGSLLGRPCCSLQNDTNNCS